MTSQHVIVAGFHRSGTSMTAQVLSRAGLHLGDALLLPDPFNRDGFFEDADIVEAHDDLLADAGHDWQYVDDDLPPVPRIGPSSSARTRSWRASRWCRP